jgi:hypothetical protein
MMKKLIILIILLLGSSIMFAQTLYDEFKQKYNEGLEKLDKDYEYKKERTRDLYGEKGKSPIYDYSNSNDNRNTSTFIIEHSNVDNTTEIYQNGQLEYYIEPRFGFGSEDKNVYKRKDSGGWEYKGTIESIDKQNEFTPNLVPSKQIEEFLKRYKYTEIKK